jgi:hypothetical protein
MNEQINEMDQEEISLDRYFAAVWRAKWIIIIGVILAAGITAYLASRQPTVHKASAELRNGRVWKEPLEDPYITQRIINSPAFLEDVAARHQLKANQLKRAIQARVITVGPPRARYPLLVSIEATADTAENAARYVRLVADEMIARHEAMFNEAIKPHVEERQRLEARHSELQAQGAAVRDLLFKVESELDQVKANNSTVSLTEKTVLITDVGYEGAQKPGSMRSTATAALIAAVALILAAALTVHIKPALKRAAAGNKS